MAVVRTGGAFGAEIVIEGLDADRNALEDLEPALRRKLDRDLLTALKSVSQTAATEVDSRTGETAKGYRVKRRGNAFRIENRTRGAAILEFAAVPHCPQGQSLVNTLNEKYGAPGRILWGAWDAMEPYVLDKVRGIVEDAEFEIERRMAAG